MARRKSRRVPLRSMAWVMAPISRNFQLSPFWAARYSREESLAPGFSYRGNTESPWAAQISSLKARRVCKVLGYNFVSCYSVIRYCFRPIRSIKILIDPTPCVIIQ